MRKKVTLKQIAKELDVSISTVSKSLKDSSEISLDVRQKVQAFAKLYHYRPNINAIGLKSRNNKTIGIIIPELINHFFSTIISGIQTVTNEKGYNVMICLSDESYDKELLNMDLLANGNIEGFIMALSKETQQKKDFNHIQDIINQGIPVVLFDRITNDILCDKVIIDDTKAAFDSVQLLLDKGFKKIALLTTIDYVSVGKLRTEGYLKALEDNNVIIDLDLILKIEDVENCQNAIDDLFKKQSFDAVFAVNELFAVAAIKSAAKNNIIVPTDISIIGFNDGIISRYSSPTISTVSQNGLKMGQIAAKMLIERLETQQDLDSDYDIEEIYKTEIVATHFVKRESTN